MLDKVQYNGFFILDKVQYKLCDFIRHGIFGIPERGIMYGKVFEQQHWLAV